MFSLLFCLLSVSVVHPSLVPLQYLPLPPGNVPPASTKYGYGKVSMAPSGSVFQMVELLQKVTNKWPLTFEELLVPNGIVVYKTVLPFRIVSHFYL